MFKYIVFYFLITISYGAISECPENCMCSYQVMNQTSRREGQWYLVNTANYTCSNISSLPNRVNMVTVLEIRESPDLLSSLNLNFVKKIPNINKLSLINVGLKSIQGNTLSTLRHLTDLNLSNNSIQTIHSDTFQGCDKLKQLIMENCQLMTIAMNAFQSLKSLEILSLAHNKINLLQDGIRGVMNATSYIEINTQRVLYIPTNIKLLNISNNDIEGTLVVNSLTMEEVNICDNLIARLDEETSLPSLNKLCLGGDQFTLQRGLLSLHHFPNITSIQLRGTDLKFLELNHKIEEDLLNLLNSGKLIYLHIDRCSLPSGRLAEQPINSQCRELRITNSEMPISTRVRKPIVFNAETVECIDLTGTPFLASKFLNPPRNIRESIPFPNLTSLILQNTQIRNFPQDLMRRNPQLKCLDISKNPLHCTCENFGWLLGFIALKKLTVKNIQETKCMSPERFKDSSLIHQDLCAQYTELDVIEENSQLRKINEGSEEILNPNTLPNKIIRGRKYDEPVSWMAIFIYTLAAFLGTVVICVMIIEFLYYKRA